MKNWKLIVAIILFLLGIVLILGAPYTPDVFFNMIANRFDYHYQDTRFLEIIPSVRMAGFILSAGGIVLFATNKKESQI